MTLHRIGQAAARRLNDWPWLAPLLFAAVVGMYFVSRYAGLWSEADSATFTTATRSVLAGGRLVPAIGQVYPNGYAYQVISAYIVALTGLRVETLQQIVYPLLAFLVVLPAWLLYRELTGSGRGATLAALLLFTQPEFLFVILRSSHEKFTRALMLLALFWLVRSLKLRSKPGLLGLHVVLFYLTTFALITSNNLLAHSFIFAIGVALVLGWVLEQRNPRLRNLTHPVLRRFSYAVVTSLVLVYIFTFYVYPPAQHDLAVLSDTWNRIAALFLDVGSKSSTATDPYTVVSAGWISLPIYFLVSIADWIVLAVSLVIWLRQAVRWLWRHETPDSRVAWFNWLFYAAFAAQGVLSVVADVSGALSSNLQHRLFPSFAIFGVALVAAELVSWRPRYKARPVSLALGAGLFSLAILSILKATNEPLVSNKWTFYRPGELAALQWSDTHFSHTSIWTEFDERLEVSFYAANQGSTNYNSFNGHAEDTTTRDLLLSDITRLRSSRFGRPIPIPPDALRIYDSGGAAVYHKRPQTPYQR